jgi:hypothetical protein
VGCYKLRYGCRFIEEALLILQYTESGLYCALKIGWMASAPLLSSAVESHFRLLSQALCSLEELQHLIHVELVLVSAKIGHLLIWALWNSLSPASQCHRSYESDLRRLTKHQNVVPDSQKGSTRNSSNTPVCESSPKPPNFRRLPAMSAREGCGPHQLHPRRERGTCFPNERWNMRTEDVRVDLCVTHVLSQTIPVRIRWSNQRTSAPAAI